MAKATSGNKGNDSERTRRSFARRAAGWALRRANAPQVVQGAKVVSSLGSEVWNSTFKPKEIDTEEARSRFEGHYTDGGARRFSEMVDMRGLTVLDLRNKTRVWRNQAIIFLASAFLLLSVGLAWMVFNPGLFSSAMGVASISLFAAFVALAAKCDYSAWQIEQRRFGGLREYLRTRIGWP